MNGGEIKNVLTLDVSKFESAVKKATDQLENLDAKLEKAEKVIGKLDKTVASLSSEMGTAAGGFRVLDAVVGNVSKKLNSAESGVKKVGDASKRASKDLEKLAGSAEKLETMAEWTAHYGKSLSKLNPALKDAAKGHTVLEKAIEKYGSTAKKSEIDVAAARAKTLANERQVNRGMLAARRTMIEELQRIEAAAQANAQRAAKDASKFFGRNSSNPKRAEALQNSTSYMAEASAASTQRNAIQEAVRALTQRNAQLREGVIASMREVQNLREMEALDRARAEHRKKLNREDKEHARSQKELDKRVDGIMSGATLSGNSAAASAAFFTKKADEEIKQAKRAERERIKAARHAAQIEREEAHATSQIWKGMATMWATTKMAQFGGKGIHAASEYQKADTRLKLFNLPDEEYGQFKQSSKELVKATPGLSMEDSLLLRMDGMSALGHNDPRILDALMPKASKAALGLKAAGYDKNDTSTIMKNLFGVIEMRQQQDDPEAAKRTIDLLVQASIASNGKLTMQDFENYFRNGGAGARQITDDGLRNIVPLMEMFKTAGGGNGGGGGIARVGNMTKMFQAYANGKPLTNKGVEQMMGAGVLNNEFEAMTVENFKKTQKANIAMMKALKANGLKDSDLLMDDPVAFLGKLREPLLNYMMGKENKGKFFQGYEDFSYDDKGQMVRSKDGKVVDKVNQANIEGAAFQKFLNSMGMSQGAIDGAATVMNIQAQERARHITEQQKKSGGAEQIYDLSMATWSGSVDKLSASARNLAVALMPVLDGMSKLVNFLASGTQAVADFVGDSAFGKVVGVVGAATLGIAAFNMTIGNAFRALKSAGSANATLKAIEGIKNGATVATPALSGLGLGLGAVAENSKGGAAQIDNLGNKAAGAAGKTGGLLSSVTQGGMAMRIMTGATAGLSMGMSLLGGPLGAISALLIVGATLWETWGSKARKALSDAKTAAEGADAYILQAQNEEKFGAGQAGTFKVQREAAFKAFSESRTKTQTGFDKVNAGVAQDTGAAFGSRKQMLDAGRKAAAARDGSSRTNAPLTTDESALQDRIATLDKAIAIAEKKDKAIAQPVTLGKVDANGVPITAEDLKAKPKGAGGAGGGTKKERVYQDAFQIRLSQFEQDAKMLDLETQGLMAGKQDYKARAEEQFIKAWMTGQFDDGKDPAQRPFANKKFDKKAGWSATDIDMSGEKQQSYIGAVQKKLEAEDINAAVSLGKGKLEAQVEDVATALSQLAAGVYGGSDAMDSLRREFARFEGTHPNAVTNSSYTDVKRQAMTNAASNDALKLSKGYREGFFDKQLQYSGKSDYEKQILSAQHIAEVEEKRMKAAEDALNKQISEEKQKGNTSSETYRNAVAALAEIEGSYGKQREILKLMVEDAKKTQVQKTFDSWGDMRGQYNNLASGWQSNISNTLKGVATGTDKINPMAFMGTVAGDLAGMFMNKGLSTANADVFGKTSFFDQAQGLLGGTGIKDGGWLGGKLNAWRGIGKDGAGTSASFGDTISNMFSDLTGNLGTFGESIKSATGNFGTFGASLWGGIKSLGEFSWSLIEEAVTAIGKFAMGLLNAPSASGGGGGGFLGTLVSGVVGYFSGGATAATGAATGAGTMASLSELGVFAKGGSFGSSGLHEFANGGAFTNGIYKSPTLFKFANGGGFNQGVMGEAGPEAVMPLQRDGSGRLGVAVNGGTAGGTNVEININVAGGSGGSTTSSAGENADNWKQLATRVKAVVVQEIVNQKRPGGALY